MQSCARSRRRLLAASLLLLAFLAQGGRDAQAQSADRQGFPQESTGAPAAQQAQEPINHRLIAADNAFGFHLFGQLVETEGVNNFFVSPISVVLALQMVYNGAQGQTRQAMAQSMGRRRSGIYERSQCGAAASLEQPRCRCVAFQSLPL